MHGCGHFVDEHGVFFDGIADDDEVGPGLAVSVGFFGVANASANDERDFDAGGYTGDHFFADGSPGAAAGIHINELHAQHFACHGGTKGDLFFVCRNRAGITDIRHGGGCAAVDDHIAGGNDLQTAVTYCGSGDDMGSDEQLGVAAGYQRKIKQTVCVSGNLGWRAGKKNDRDGAMAADEPNYVVEMVGNDEAAANKEVIDASADRQTCDFFDFLRIHIVRIDQYSQRALPFSFFGQQGFVNKLLHLLPLLVQKCKKSSALGSEIDKISKIAMAIN